MPVEKSKSVSPAQLEQRRMAARTHSARSHVEVRRRAGYVKQGILQPLGIRYADLPLIMRKQLDLYSRVVTKIELYDDWADAHGFLQTDGSSPPWVKEYYAAVNSAGRLLSKLDEHLHRYQQAGPSPLELHLAEHYTVEEGEFSEIEGNGR